MRKKSAVELKATGHQRGNRRASGVKAATSSLGCAFWSVLFLALFAVMLFVAMSH